jgi:membrane-associated phospholipid phosphatase
VPPAAPARFPYGLAAALALGSAAVAVAVSAWFDLPLRDPDGVAGPAYVRLPLIVLLFFVADVLPRALHRARGLRRAWSELGAVVRERWTPRRLTLVAVGLASFYATYVAYRNLKGALPFARDRLYDPMLLDLDRAMAFGVDPATVLHTVLGTGVAAHVLSAVYLLFLAFVPISLGAALVWARDVRAGAWYVTALCLNWLLGTVSYYLLPSLGPVFVRPGLFADLPETGVTALQRSLLENRLEVLADPIAANAVQGIAGFASLHTSIVLTGALVAHRMGLHRVVRWSMWVFFVLTVVATVYFGWHYLIDDVAGVGIAFASLWIAGRATGHRWRQPVEKADLSHSPLPVQQIAAESLETQQIKQ